MRGLTELAAVAAIRGQPIIHLVVTANADAPTTDGRRMSANGEGEQAGTLVALFATPAWTVGLDQGARTPSRMGAPGVAGVPADGVWLMTVKGASWS